jgi:enamine deaminase RidA (YjgF/YER057c/UK114 family)
MTTRALMAILMMTAAALLTGCATDQATAMSDAMFNVAATGARLDGDEATAQQVEQQAKQAKQNIKQAAQAAEFLAKLSNN